jgi:hypothetical protein
MGTKGYVLPEGVTSNKAGYRSEVSKKASSMAQICHGRVVAQAQMSTNFSREWGPGFAATFDL